MPDTFNPAVFILIRFAMVAPFSTAFNDRDVARKWLARRTPVFHTICLPGLERQTVRPTATLIGLVEGLENEADIIIGAVGDVKSKRLVPAFQSSDAGGAQSIMNAFRKEMVKHVQESHTHIITIRLDNDDAIHEAYVENIVNHFHKELRSKPDESDFFASYAFGMQADNNGLYTYVYPNGPFQARMEKLKPDFPADKVKGVYVINHTKVFREKNASLIVIQSPSWIQYIHGSNVANCLKGGALKIEGIESLLRGFGLSPSVFKEDLASLSA